MTIKDYSHKFTIIIQYSHPTILVPLYFFIVKTKKKKGYKH